ncbi:MAG: repeat containing protein [Edaphobacter sp.]|nr:repeat containing protein [Edaphobacter sp.]
MTHATLFCAGVLGVIGMASMRAEAQTDFGAVNVGATSSAVPLTLTFATAGTVSSTAVLTQGVTGLDFAAAAAGSCTAGVAYNAGDTCTVNVTFSPKQVGTRYGAAVLSDALGRAIATGYVSGTGSGPQVAFLPVGQTVVAGSGLNLPYAVAVDGSGNVYIADGGNGRILKMTLSGGSYTQSIVVSGLNFPAGVAVDGSGNVYIADSGNNQVLKESLSSSGYVQTIVADSTKVFAPLGVAVDGSGNVYVADTNNNRVVKETLSGSTYTQTIVVGGLNVPAGVAVDRGGNVYIGNTNNNQVLLETLSGGSYTQTVVGIGFIRPSGVAVDGSGNVYVADYGNSRVVKVPSGCGSSACQTTVGSGLNNPYGVAVEGSGNVYIADFHNNRVLKEDTGDPPSLRFLPTNVGATSSDSPQTVTVANIGNAVLTFQGTSPSISPNFTLSNTSTCPLTSTLAAGANCTLLVSFSPTVPGPISGTLVLTDDHLNAVGPGYATQTIVLNGGLITLSPTSLLAGTVAVPYSQSVAATGGRPLYTYAVTGGALPAGLNLASVSGLISGTPTAGGTFNFTVTATDATVPTAATGSQAYTLTVGKGAVTVTWSNPAGIAYGTALSATQLNATASIVGTFAYTPAAGTVLGLGTQTLNVTFTPTDTASYNTATKAVSLVVAPAGTTTSLNVSSASVVAGASVTLTAQVVSATTGTPTGTVSFYDGATTLLNTATLSGGSASYATTSLAVGVHTLTAVYNGDANFTTSRTASATTVTVVAPDFSLNLSGGQSQTVTAGSAATYSFAVAPTSGVYPGAVSFSASGLPTGATATFSPASISSADGAKTVTLTIQTSATAALQHAPMPGSRMVPISLALLLLPVLGSGRMRRRGRGMGRLLCLMLLGGVAATSMLIGCGGSNSSTNPPAKTTKSYPITVTATSGGVQHAASVTLNVQ